MRIAILIPSAGYRATAGVRIRYSRLAADNNSNDIDVVLQEIDSFDPRSTDCDVLIASKCYDARSLIAAELMARRGRIVGVDLFDDYFSQLAESRLCRFRTWLRQMLSIADFATCSTEAMANVARSYRSDLPIHILKDTAPTIDYDRLEGSLSDKLHRAKAEQRLRLCWFGVGDNPYFSTGLRDLTAFAGWLKQLSSHSVGLELEVLTNSRALDTEGLRAISSLPIPTSVNEWSEKCEAELLRRSFAVFLPASAQNFSLAKSLNRAVTAFSEACQVLSVGFPLYQQFAPFLYRAPDGLIQDFARGRMRFDSFSVSQFRAAIEGVASAASEVSSLGTFLKQVHLCRHPREDAGPLVVVHGAKTNAAVHSAVHQGGGFSVASPFCTAPLAFDAVCKASGGSEEALLVTRRAVGRLLPCFKKDAVPFGRIGRRKFWQLDNIDKSAAGFDWVKGALPLQLSMYGRVMATLSKRLKSNFGSARIILSEDSPMPFEPLD